MNTSHLNSGISACLVLLCSGCNIAGPTAIRQGRNNYNEAIHDTSREQVLLNFVRVANYDSTLFIDVTEVDAAMQFSGSLNASAMLPQAKSASGQSSTAVTSGGTSSGQTVRTTNVPLLSGHDFSLTAGTTYQESPTVRYQPLLGQPLIAQIATPISPDSIGTMVDSDWPIRSLLNLVADRLTPNYVDYYTALDYIGELDDYGTLVIVPTHSADAAQSESGGNGITQFLTLSASAAVAPKATSPSQADSLTLFFNPQGANSGATAEWVCGHVDETWSKLCGLYGDAAGIAYNNHRLNIRFAAPAATSKKDKTITPPPKGAPPDMPVLRTRSGLGILRAATHEDWGIAVIISNTDRDRIQPLIYLTAHPEIVSGLHLLPNWRDEHPNELDPTWEEVRDAFVTLLVHSQLWNLLTADQIRSLDELKSLGKQLKEGDFDVTDDIKKYPFCHLNTDEIRALAMLQISFLQHQDQHTGPDDSYARNFYVFDANQLASDQLRRARPVAPDVEQQQISRRSADDSAYEDTQEQSKIRSFQEAHVRREVAEAAMHPKTPCLFPAIGSPAAKNGVNRHLIVLVSQDGEPSDPFVDVVYRRKHYYVANDDDISRKNLAMIHHFLTVQAVPTPNGTLTPTINVGAP